MGRKERERRAGSRLAGASDHAWQVGIRTTGPVGEAGPVSAGDRALEALTALLLRVDGWLRIVPHDHGKTVYFKFKFTSRQWPNHYVMYVEHEYCYVCGLIGLLEKVHEVDLGVRKPVEDTPYDQS